MAVIEVDTGVKTIAQTNSRRVRIIIQNTGTEPALISIDKNPSIEDYNFVLAADTNNREGNGGSVTLEGIHGEIKGVTETNETNLSVTEIYN